MSPAQPELSGLDAEHALNKSEAMLAESQRLAKIGSFELDVETLSLTWSDQQFRNFGFEPARAIDRAAVIARIVPADRERHEAVVRAAIASGEPFAVDYRVMLPDGTIRHFHTIGQPVVDAEGRVAKVVGTSQDITERVLLEDQLRAQYEQLKQVDQHKSNFVHMVNHEVRSPLTSILGYAELLEEEIDGPVTPEQRASIGQIKRGVRRLEFLLNDLVDYACLEAGTFRLKLAQGCLADWVNEVLASLKPQADSKRIRLEACLPDGPLELEMDAQRIGQVLTNLVSNAIKFSPFGGSIRVGVHRRGEHVRCTIADDGLGITPLEIPTLFQHFSELEAGLKKGKRIGLGLSISKALVEAHGGAIGAESTPMAGSTFWFELPVRVSESVERT